MEIRNPVVPGFHPDPSVCRVGEDYYLATSTFEYYPGVPIFHSRDLVSWERVGHALDEQVLAGQIDLTDVRSSGGIFAPTLREHGGTFYLVTTNVDGGGHFVVTADDPAGPWSEPTYVDAGGIDPDLFFEDDTAYVTYTAGESLADMTITQAELDFETGALGESRELWRGIEGSFSEAPHLYEVDGTYYLLTAEGGTHTGHMVVAARSDLPTGPFEGCPDNPILSHRGHLTEPIQATGHADLVDAPDGSWWLLFLGIRQTGHHPGRHHLGRETFLAPVEWEAGWPVVNGGDPVGLEVDVESLPGDDAAATGADASRPAEPARPMVDDFDATPTEDGNVLDALDGAWNARRPPRPDAYSLAERPSALTLWGRTASLDERRPTFLGRRQAHFACRAAVDLTFDPDEGEEAGLAVVYDEDHHYEVGLRQDEGRREVAVRLQIGDATDVVARRAVEGTDHSFAITADEERYRFYHAEGDDGSDSGHGTSFGDSPAEDPLATAGTRYLATEVAGGFTGVYVGPYATSGDAEPVTPAHVDRFEYAPIEE